MSEADSQVLAGCSGTGNRAVFFFFFPGFPFQAFDYEQKKLLATKGKGHRTASPFGPSAHPHFSSSLGD